MKKGIHFILTPVHWVYKVLHICNLWSIGFLIGISPLLLVLINEIRYIRGGYHSVWTAFYVMTIGLICLGVVGMIIQAALAILEFFLSYIDILWRKTRKRKTPPPRYRQIPPQYEQIPPRHDSRFQNEAKRVDPALRKYERAKDMLLLEDGFTEEELKKAYRTHLKMYHPDTGEKDETPILKINEAYQVLKQYAK